MSYINNAINLTGANSIGIRFADIDSSVPVRVVGGTIDGGAFGVVATQAFRDGVDGQLVLDGLTVANSTEAALTFSTDPLLQNQRLSVALQNAVAIEGGASPDDDGIVLEGPGVALAGDTLNDTAFAGQNGNYIELRNRALFEPGQPTVVDATGVTFDALDPAQPADALAIEDGIVHNPDDGTLGLIDFGAAPGQTASGSP